METRIVYTSFWVNSVQENLSLEAQLLYIYLITCPYIGICSVFRLPDQYILIDLRLNKKQLQSAKRELTRKKKAYFYEGWINLVKAEHFINYKKSPLNFKKYQRQVSYIPKDVLTKLSYKVDSSIQTLDTNHKSEIINNKSEIKNQKRVEEIKKQIRKRFRVKHEK